MEQYKRIIRKMIRNREDMQKQILNYFESIENDCIYICWNCNTVVTSLLTNEVCRYQRWCKGNMCICVSCEYKYNLNPQLICSVCEHYKMIKSMLPLIKELNDIIMLYL